MDAKRWLRIIDRNLCWSGVFLVTDSRYKTCQTAGGNQVDMKIMLTLKGTVTDNGDLVPKHLMLTVADNDGVPLFPLELPIRKNRFREAELMDLINEMSVQFTGLKGILGSTIAFTLKQPKRRKIIARINTHGKKLAAVSRNKYINLLPSWSPKGDAIVYTTLSRRGTAIMFNDCLKVVGCKYRPVKLLSSNISAARISKSFLSVSGGTWFSNGHKLIVTLSRKGNSDLYEFDRLKRKVIRLTTHRAIDTVPDLSPDNQHLIFVSDRSGHEQIYYLKLGTKIPFQLTFGRGSSSDPVWSPDGTLIAFSKISSGHSQIHLMDPFTGEDNFLTRGRFNSEQPFWSPDGRQIAFVSSSTGFDKLYIMFIDGTGRRRLTRTPRDFEEGGPSWTARKF
jgi:TolB protein